MANDEHSQGAPPAPSAAKRPYSQPKLTRYGQVEAIVTGFSGAVADGASGMFQGAEMGMQKM